MESWWLFETDINPVCMKFTLFGVNVSIFFHSACLLAFLHNGKVQIQASQLSAQQLQQSSQECKCRQKLKTVLCNLASGCSPHGSRKCTLTTMTQTRQLYAGKPQQHKFHRGKIAPLSQVIKKTNKRLTEHR